MLSLLTFAGVAALTADLVMRRGAQVWAWMKGAEQTAVSATKNVADTVVSDVKKVL